jgi:hypothetical protein
MDLMLILRVLAALDVRITLQSRVGSVSTPLT